jgi:hypothetical protein
MVPALGATAAAPIRAFFCDVAHCRKGGLIMRRIIIAAVVTLAGTLAFAAPALAKSGPRPVPRSTFKCTHGTYSGYCGTQTDLEVPPMSIVSGGSARQNRFIYAKPNSTKDPLSDFFWFRFQGGSANIAEFTPNGVTSHFCIAQTSDFSGLKLRSCNGSTFQQWTAIPVTGGFEWQNGATGNIIQSNGEGNQIRGVTAPVSALDTQTWNFVG